MKTIALVGADSPPTEQDQGQKGESLLWLFENDSGFRDGLECQSVNLKQGRDYLSEKTKHDVVIVHNIFDARGITRVPDCLKGQVSPLDKNGAWAKKLSKSGAQYIFIWEAGQPCCMNCWNVGKIKGYKPVHRDARFGVFQKEQSAHNQRKEMTE